MIAAHQARWWFDRLQVGLFERTGPAPHALIDHLSRVNLGRGSAAPAFAAYPADDLRDDLAAAIDGLPMALLQMLEPRLLGVYFCRGLGSSAATDIVSTPGGMAIGAVVVLDIDALRHTTANQWASWRERSAFAADADIEVQVCLTAPERDDRMHAIQYLLLHEFGHVLAATWLHMPQWWGAASALQAADTYHFLPLGWQIDAAARVVPLPGADCELRLALAFYGDATLNAAQAATLYHWLQSSTFCSLYGATSVFEDFAETFAGFVHVLLLGNRYSVRVALVGRPALVLDDYWHSARSLDKRRFMQTFLGVAG